jgi:hypothetical protein
MRRFVEPSPQSRRLRRSIQHGTLTETLDAQLSMFRSTVGRSTGFCGILATVRENCGPYPDGRLFQTFKVP